MSLDSGAVGRRLSYWRARRGYTRQQFADMVGRSTSWLVKVERGERALARLPMLELVAAALEIDVRVLTDDAHDPRAAQCPDSVEIEAIKAALGAYGNLLGRHDGAGGPSLRRLCQNVEHACATWLNSHFTALARVLPGLISEAQIAVEHADDGARVETVRQLVMTYRLASSMLIKFEARELAWLAADRSIGMANTTGDLVCLARASRSVARAMTEMGQHQAAIEALTTMAARMEPDIGQNPELICLYGMLLLPAEIAAAHTGDAAMALLMHREAAVVAARLGDGYSHRLTAFGPANVAVHRLAALVRLHEGGRALKSTTFADAKMLAVLPRERRANYLLDLSRAYQQARRVREAVDALCDAERLAPEEVRCRPVAHRLIRTLLSTGTGGNSRALRELARRAAVAA